MTTNHTSRPSDPTEQKKWDAGYAHGWDDKNIPYWRRSAYSPSFLLGYDVGKVEIDHAVEDAVEAKQRYGEWL